MNRNKRVLNNLQMQKRQQPAHPMVRLRLAHALDAAGECQRAGTEYHAAAQLFLRLGFARKARSVYRLLLERDPSDTDASYGMACAEHEIEQATGKVRNVREALIAYADDDVIDLRTDPHLELTPTTRPHRERRRTPRIEWDGVVDLFDGKQVVHAAGADVSTTGMRVTPQPDQRLEIGDSVKVSLSIPGQPWSGVLRGQITRVYDNGDVGIHIDWVDKLTFGHVVHVIARALGVSDRVVRQVHNSAIRTRF